METHVLNTDKHTKLFVFFSQPRMIGRLKTTRVNINPLKSFNALPQCLYLVTPFPKNVAFENREGNSNVEITCNATKNPGTNNLTSRGVYLFYQASFISGTQKLIYF